MFILLDGVWIFMVTRNLKINVMHVRLYVLSLVFPLCRIKLRMRDVVSAWVTDVHS